MIGSRNLTLAAVAKELIDMSTKVELKIFLLVLPIDF